MMALHGMALPLTAVSYRIAYLDYLFCCLLTHVLLVDLCEAKPLPGDPTGKERGEEESLFIWDFH